MNEVQSAQPPQAIARQLDVSSATLRRWSDEFATFLSEEATSSEGRSHRRYTDSDLSTLQVIKELMNSGMTYEQVRQELVSPITIPEEYAFGAGQGDTMDSSNRADFDEFEQAEPEAIEEGQNVAKEQTEDEEQSALVAANGAESAVAFLTNTLATLSDSQKSIINSQAANRELLGVLIQDNFNLKEENNRLRERILEVERDVARTRQDEEWRLETLRREFEAKVANVQQLATEALTTANNVELPEIKAVKEKPGCLGALFGGGDTQIVTVPRRRGRDARGKARGAAGSMPLSSSSSSSSSPSPAPSSARPAHPKPSFPPE